MKTEEMTIEQLQAAERRHDDTYNEGGDGYNPYTAKIEERACEREAARVKSNDELICDLYHKMETECGSVAEECGTDVDAKRAAYRAQISDLRAEMDAEFVAEWTTGVTMARRADWNSMVCDGQFERPSGGSGVNRAAAYQQEQSQGWTLDDLKRAVKLHGLK